MSDALPPQFPQIKVCGTTSVQDAVLSAQAGADALGFIFAPISKRLVSPQVAREASLSVGFTVARVGVFLGQRLDEVLRLAEASRMSAVQLHGPLEPEFVETVTGFYPVLRVLKAAELTGDEAAHWQAHPHVTLMVDAPIPGSGEPLEWEKLRATLPPGAWLAGGLGPENVQEAVRLLRPAGVDAVTRLESHPGVKNPQALQAFVDAVKRS